MLTDPVLLVFVVGIRTKLDATLTQQTAQRIGLEKSLADTARESDALLTLKLRAQVDDDTFERRRLGLLDRQAKLRLELEQPTPTPEAMLARLQKVLDFSTSLPQAFKEGDAVRRRQIFHAVCANPVVTDRKALYKAKEPFSFFEGSGLIRSWCPPEESNLYREIRNLVSYPLNEGGSV